MDDMYYLGQIVLFPYNFAPANFYECNGMPLDVNEHAALYSLLGDKFGGEYDKTFNLPNMVNAAPHGMIYCICYAGIYPPRN